MCTVFTTFIGPVFSVKQWLMWKSVHGCGSWPGTWSRSYPHGTGNYLWWVWNHSAVCSWAHTRTGLAQGIVCVCNTREGIKTGWDLAPGTLCCKACTWTNISSNYKIQRNYTRLKVLVTVQLGQFLDKDTKRPRTPAASSGGPVAHARSRTCPLHSTPPSSVQFSSVAQLCPTLCNPMNCSMPGLPVHHQLPEFTRIHVYRVSDAIQPSYPLSSYSSCHTSPTAPNPSQHQSLFQWVNSSHEVAKVLEFQL